MYSHSNKEEEILQNSQLHYYLALQFARNFDWSSNRLFKQKQPEAVDRVHSSAKSATQRWSLHQRV